jgi:hypothetical protein
MRPYTALLFAVLFLPASNHDVSAQVRIDTRNAYYTADANPRAPSIYQDGEPMNGVLALVGQGQSFTAPPGVSHLSSFSFWVAGCLPNTPPPPGVTALYCSGHFEIKAYIFKWDAIANQVTGPALFESEVRDISHIDTREYRFNTSSVGVNSGDMYVALLAPARMTTDGEPLYCDGTINPFTNSPNCWSHGQLNTFRGGASLRLNSGAQFGMGYGDGGLVNFSTYAARLMSATRLSVDVSSSMIANSNWSSLHNPNDPSMSMGADFVADFSEVEPTVTPEPVTFSLLGTGLAGLAALKRRRRKRYSDEAVS